jgi:hypothetical protein
MVYLTIVLVAQAILRRAVSFPRGVRLIVSPLGTSTTNRGN